MAKRTSDEFRALVANTMTDFQAGRLAAAERAYRAALASVPADPAVTCNLGVALVVQGRHRAAVGCFEEALRADPSFVSAHYNRGVALLRLGKQPQAIEAFAAPSRSSRSIARPIATSASSDCRKASGSS